MKIVITASSDSLDDPIDKRFGRAPGYILYDSDTQTHQFINNQENTQAAQGAGIQAAQRIINSGAQCVISGQCGPKALQVLSSADIAVYSSDAATIRACIEQYNNGTLQHVQAN